jgi:hypothetical protein
MKKTLLIMGIIAMVLIPVWIFLVLPNLLKIPLDYSNDWKLAHSENDKFEINGTWTKQYAINTFWTENLNNNIFETYFVVGEGENIVYNIKNKFVVDKKTRHNLAGETDKNGESYSIFPLNVKKEDYNYWPAAYGRGLLFKFDGIEKRYNLDVYHFLAENQVSDDTAGYEFLDLVPEKYNVLSKFNIDIYVEPVSGIIVDYEDKGGSYYADSQGNRVQDMSEWGNRFDYNTIKQQADKANSEKNKIFFYEWVAPILLGIIGIVLLIVGVVWKKEK